MDEDQRPVQLARKKRSTTTSLVARMPLIGSVRAQRGTEEKLRIVLETYMKTGRLNFACDMAGIPRSTHYDRVKIDPVYAAAVETAERVVSQEIEDKVYECAIAGDMTAATLLLKRFRPELYRERISTDTTITVNLVDRMTAANERLLMLRRGDAGEQPEVLDASSHREEEIT